jgi:hypothetical protein
MQRAKIVDTGDVLHERSPARLIESLASEGFGVI